MPRPLPLRHFEQIDGALSALLACELLPANCWTREYNPARLESRLFDACLGAGMSYDTPSVRDWAVERVTATLMAA